MNYRHLICASLLALFAFNTTACESVRTQNDWMVAEKSSRPMSSDGESNSGLVIINEPTDIYVNVAPLSPIYFGFDSKELDPADKAQLDSYINAMTSDMTITLVGHTDEPGTPEYNEELGQARAEVIREYLLSKGVTNINIQVATHGEEHRVIKTNERHWRNRRVEFRVTTTATALN